MSPVERRTRILIALALATIFIGYFIYSYPTDATTGSWVELGIDGILLALGSYCLFQAIRGTWKLFSNRSEEIPSSPSPASSPSPSARNRESINFRG